MTDSELIDALGGTGAVAALFKSDLRRGRISPAAVSQWRKKGIPPARRRKMRRILEEGVANV